MAQKEKVRCCECGRVFVGREIPRGDGSRLRPASHENNGKLCIGRKMLGEAVKERPLIEELIEVVESCGLKMTFSANCLSGIVGKECGCWRCREERGEKHDIGTEAQAAREQMFFRKGEEHGKSIGVFVGGQLARGEGPELNIPESLRAKDDPYARGFRDAAVTLVAALKRG